VEEPGGLERALSGGDVAATMEAWCWYFWHCCYMSGIGTTVEGVVSVFRRCSDATCHS
jgi:fructose-1,6-bisphosphatase/sedoheptulose 1,7-bisphosphatase-like protein